MNENHKLLKNDFLVTLYFFLSISTFIDKNVNIFFFLSIGLLIFIIVKKGFKNSIKDILLYSLILHLNIFILISNEFGKALFILALLCLTFMVISLEVSLIKKIDTKKVLVFNTLKVLFILVILLLKKHFFIIPFLERGLPINQRYNVIISFLIYIYILDVLRYFYYKKFIKE